MNAVLTFLRSNWQRLDLERYGASDRLSYFMVTQQSRTTRNVVFLILAEGKPDPVLVVKVPRLAGARAGVQREANNLRAIQTARPGGFDSIPRVVAFEEDGGRPMLIETALVGQPMEPDTVRRGSASYCTSVTGWLVETQWTTHCHTGTASGWFERLIERPLRHFATVFPLSAAETVLLERTAAEAASLRETDLPLVFEHGDMSRPNILVCKNGETGVVDWELAEPCGLPICDLFFFLANTAFAMYQSHKSGDYLSAFHATFFGRTAWARAYVRAYTERFKLPLHLLTPLFVLCWARYTDNLLHRISDDRCPQEPIATETAAWLRSYRYYKLWRHTLSHLKELRWHDSSHALGEGSKRRLSIPLIN